MAIITCRKCGSINNVHTLSNGIYTCIYCNDCGSWIQKIEETIVKQIEFGEVVPEDEELSIDLSQFSNEELLEEISRRMG